MKTKDCKAKKKAMAKKMAKSMSATAADKRDVAFAKKSTDYSQPRS